MGPWGRQSVKTQTVLDTAVRVRPVLTSTAAGFTSGRDGLKSDREILHKTQNHSWLRCPPGFTPAHW